MRINQIETLEELADFMEAANNYHETLASRFDKETDENKFISDLIRNFTPQAYYFGEFFDNGDLKFFAVIYPSVEKGAAYWWLLYSHPRFREFTKPIIREIKEKLKNDGFARVYSRTSRVKASYRRFMKSLEGYPVAEEYEMPL